MKHVFRHAALAESHNVKDFGLVFGVSFFVVVQEGLEDVYRVLLGEVTPGIDRSVDTAGEIVHRSWVLVSSWGKDNRDVLVRSNVRRIEKKEDKQPTECSWPVGGRSQCLTVV